MSLAANSILHEKRCVPTHGCHGPENSSSAIPQHSCGSGVAYLAASVINRRLQDEWWHLVH